MDEDDRQEIQALVSGFLTTNLQNHPNGFELGEFERIFPEQSDEERDWYKRYKMPNTLEAIKNIGDSVRISTDRYNRILISLNTRSKDVDRHLVDLVINQKASSKKRGKGYKGRDAQRVKDSFAINKRYSTSSQQYSYNAANRMRPRFGNENSQQLRSHHQQERPPPPSSPWAWNQQPTPPLPQRQVCADPRIRQSAGSPQVRPTPFPPSGPTPTKQSQTTTVNQSGAQIRRPPSIYTTTEQAPKRPTTQSSTPAALIRTPRVAQPPVQQQPTPRVEPAILRKREEVGKNLYDLLSLHIEVKILFLSTLYQREYPNCPPLDPVQLGYKSLTQLYQSYDFVRIHYKQSMPTVSLVTPSEMKGKENIASKNANNTETGSCADSGNTSASPMTPTRLGMKDNDQSTRSRYRAIDPFNVATMLSSLEPLREIKEPPLGSNVLEDMIKYRTLRIIFKEPDQTLKLDDWERKYQQEWNCANKIQIRDYGFRTLLEFFKELSRHIPIRIRLKDDEWIAVVDCNSISIWIKKQMSLGNYKAITAIDAKYEHIAFPGDTYNYLDLKNIQQLEYYSAIKLAVKSAHKLWLQMGAQDRVEDNITFETSSSCYDDYKRKFFFTIPPEFLIPGFPCAAYDESEQRWCRAIVVKVPEVSATNSIITAHLVDYSMSRDFKRSNLLCILKNHMKQPVGNLQ